jgi:hypothetical protein
MIKRILDKPPAGKALFKRSIENAVNHVKEEPP